jgi:hypothetical protein
VRDSVTVNGGGGSAPGKVDMRRRGTLSTHNRTAALLMQESDQTYVLIIYRREIPRGPKKILTPEIVKKLKEQHI